MTTESTYWQKLEHIIDCGPYQDRGEPHRKAFTDWLVAQDDVNSVLDAGCNTGLTCYLLRKAGYEGLYTGIDSNERAIDIARDRIRFEAHVWNGWCVCNIAEVDAPHDVVYLKDVIEHEDDPWPTLRACARNARKYLVLSFFLPLSETEPVYRTCDGGGGLTYSENHHSRSQVYGYLAEDGFELAEVLYQADKIEENRQPQVLLFKRSRPQSPSGEGERVPPWEEEAPPRIEPSPR